LEKKHDFSYIDIGSIQAPGTFLSMLCHSAHTHLDVWRLSRTSMWGNVQRRRYCPV